MPTPEREVGETPRPLSTTRISAISSTAATSTSTSVACPCRTELRINSSTAERRTSKTSSSSATSGTTPMTRAACPVASLRSAASTAPATEARASIPRCSRPATSSSSSLASRPRSTSLACMTYLMELSTSSCRRVPVSRHILARSCTAIAFAVWRSRYRRRASASCASRTSPFHASHMARAPASTRATCTQPPAVASPPEMTFAGRPRQAIARMAAPLKATTRPTAREQSVTLM